MADRLLGKSVLVSAAARGIGKAIALGFAAEGASVMATDLDSEELSVLNGVDGITTRVLDVTNATAVNQLAVAMGRVDVLCNIAGFVHHGSILDLEEEQSELEHSKYFGRGSRENSLNQLALFQSIVPISIITYILYL